MPVREHALCRGVPMERRSRSAALQPRAAPQQLRLALLEKRPSDRPAGFARGRGPGGLKRDRR
eukprot:9284363-Lingulodinium_polyedra.AAC.1